MNIDANTARLKFCSINYFIRFNIYKFFPFIFSDFKLFLSKLDVPGSVHRNIQGEHKNTP
jgi:hypothetical protein